MACTHIILHMFNVYEEYLNLKKSTVIGTSYLTHFWGLLI